ncbi:MAG: hypothetical protein JWO97_4157 [Acidobacteria bacterium]|nr:hypothetical protein [Acidobacteriota bacterium]
MKLTAILVLVGCLLAFPAVAQKTLGDGVKELATQISAGVAKQQKQKIAVLPFRELDGQTTVLGTYLAEELVTNLFQMGNFEIVERQLLDKVLGELKTQQSGAVDPQTAKEIGRVAGVDAIVTGSITDLQSFVGINCRLIDTTTGKIFGAAQTKITKDDDVKKIMSTPMATPERKAPAAKASAAKGAAGPSWSGSEVKVVVDKAERKGDIISLTLGLETMTERGGSYRFSSPYLLDENGERWNCADDYTFFNLLPQTRIRVRLMFRPLRPGGDGTTFTLVHEEWRMTLRGIVPATP